MPGILQLWPLNACNALIVVHPPINTFPTLDQYFSHPQSIIFQPSINTFASLKLQWQNLTVISRLLIFPCSPCRAALASLHLNSGLVAFKLPASETHHGSQQLSQGLDIGALGQLQRAWMHIVHKSNSWNGNNGISTSYNGNNGRSNTMGMQQSHKMLWLQTLRLKGCIYRHGNGSQNIWLCVTFANTLHNLAMLQNIAKWSN